MGGIIRVLQAVLAYTQVFGVQKSRLLHADYCLAVVFKHWLVEWSKAGSKNHSSGGVRCVLARIDASAVAELVEALEKRLCKNLEYLVLLIETVNSTLTAAVHQCNVDVGKRRREIDQ